MKYRKQLSGMDSEKNLVRLFERSERRAIMLSIMLPIIASSILFFNDYRQHRRVAYYFSEIVRYEIITGSIRDAAYQAQRMVMKNGPFFRIQYLNFDGRKLIDQTGIEDAPLLGNTIQHTLYYDAAKQGKKIGDLTYTYSLDGFLAMSAVFFFASAFSVIGYLVRHRRITARKIEEEITRQRNEAIGKTINGIAHDLRAPLNMIEIFLTHVQDKSSKDYCSAKQGLYRIYAMIESLRFGAVDQIVKPALAVLDVTYVSQLLQSLAMQNGKELMIEVKHELILPVDQVKIERVIQNLVVNAIESSKLQVILRVHGLGGTLKIEVEDDGDGVPAEILPRLFQRGATYGKQGGTGLGLSYCKAVVEGHGGSISYGRFSTRTVFTVNIPLAVVNYPASFDEPPSVKTTRKATVACILSDIQRQGRVLKQLKAVLPHVQTGTQRDFAKLADVVFVDSLDVVEHLPNADLIFVKDQDDESLLIRKLQSILTRRNLA